MYGISGQSHSLQIAANQIDLQILYVGAHMDDFTGANRTARLLTTGCSGRLNYVARLE